MNSEKLIRRVGLAAGVLAAAMSVGGSFVASSHAAKGKVVALPEPLREGTLSVERALAQRRSIRDFAAEQLPLSAASQVLWAAQGITHPEGLRTAPSAGALYPLELYLVVGDVAGLPPALYRYDPGRHRLLTQREGDLREAIADAALGQDWMAEAPAMLVLAAIERRTARKYGGRAGRYVHMEVGHAAQNVYLQAVALELGTVIVGAFEDRQLQRVLGLPAEVEPLALMPVGKPR